MFIRFDTIHERDRHTDGHTDTARRLRPRLHSLGRQKFRRFSSDTERLAISVLQLSYLFSQGKDTGQANYQTDRWSVMWRPRRRLA